MRPGTETPLEGTWDQTAKQELTPYRELPMDRMTDTCKKLPCPKLRLRAVKITKLRLCLHHYLTLNGLSFSMRTEV